MREATQGVKTKCICACMTILLVCAFFPPRQPKFSSHFILSGEPNREIKKLDHQQLKVKKVKNHKNIVGHQ